MLFKQARDFLISNRKNYEVAVRDFKWPECYDFNWGIDWFDKELASGAPSRDQLALWLIDSNTGIEKKATFGELSTRSNQVANFLTSLGLKPGDRLLLVLGNVVPLWEIMLAAIKLGVVVVPATTLLTAAELEDRARRSGAAIVITSREHVGKFGTLFEKVIKVVVGGNPVVGWSSYSLAARFSSALQSESRPAASDPLLLYFTSGTTAQPKLVLHSHRSYPVGALSTMYWLGVIPGDIHLNISSPGWAKHAWSSFFAPWNAGATILVINQERFSAATVLDALVRCKVTTMCAPPTAWRVLVQEDLSKWKVFLREMCSAGEPLNPEVISHVKRSWNVTIRDGFGQTETTAQVGNTPGQEVHPGSMGMPLPGYKILILDENLSPAEEGKVCIDLSSGRPAGLMCGYQLEDGSIQQIQGDIYVTGDVAIQNKDGSLTFVGRTDDVFKSSDYRISPFELESVLIEHELVSEAAVVPAPDERRHTIPKAYVTLRGGVTPSADVATDLFAFANSRLAPFKRIRKLEFMADLPKTISGKIRRIQLRKHAADRASGVNLDGIEFTEIKTRVLAHTSGE